MLNSALLDVYDNIDRRLGRHAWILPWAVAAGAYLINRKVRHQSKIHALASSALIATSTAGLVAAGKNAQNTVQISYPS
jgi:hypothetical protein